MSNFDKTQAKTFGLLVDANNLYSEHMETFPLPLIDSKLANDKSFDL